VGAEAPHIPVRQKAFAPPAIELFNPALQDIPPLVELFKNILDYFSLYGSGGPPEFIKGYGEPPVNFRVNRIVPVAELLGAYPFLSGPGLGGSAVLVGAADIERLIAPKPAEPGKGVGG
jgi:hypothetical protein